MDSVGSLLPKVLRKRGLKQHADAALVIHKSQEWLAANLVQSANRLRCTALKGNELMIECSDSIAAQECQMILEDLKTFLQTEVQGLSVESIRLLRV